MPQLFTPIALRDLEVRNRVWVSPMCQYSCEDKDGVPTDWHLVHLGSFARGGAGLVMAEATGVSPEGRITPWCTGIWNDEQATAWRRITDFIHSQGATAAIQLQHAGRKASTYRDQSGRGSVPLDEGGWETVGPSSVAFPGYETPAALDAAGLTKVVADFAAAARRAVDAGFDVVEVHGAHGYLLHQFLSPFSNQRDDSYGGSLDNRARLILEVTRAVREEVGDAVPVLVRISASEWLDPEGFTLDDAVEVSRWLREAGADLIDVSTGGNVPGVKIPSAPGYQVPHASRIRREASVPTGAVGQITEAAQAQQIVADGDADVAFVARQFMRDPHLPLRWAHELGADVEWPVQYMRGRWK